MHINRINLQIYMRIHAPQLGEHNNICLLNILVGIHETRKMYALRTLHHQNHLELQIHHFVASVATEVRRHPIY